MASAPTPARSRDVLLDLWRGIALLDMAWVHLAVYPIGLTATAHEWIGEHTRFAAGCFVLLSGMTVARVFGPRLAEGGPTERATIVRLLRRALLLLVVGRLASFAFGWIQAARLLEPGYHAPGPELWPVLTFAEAGATGGLLLLYAVLLTLTPLLERLRARIGDGRVMLASLAVFALAAAAGERAHWPPWTFPFAHWQPLYVLGYLVSPHLDRLRDDRGVVALSWRGAVTAATAALFAIRSGPALGLDASLVPSWSFGKVPLQPAELAWYAVSSSFVLTWSAWLHETRGSVRAGTAWIRRLGRWSLVVYVVHLFFEMPIAELVIFLEMPAPARILMLPLMALALHLVALSADRLKAWKPRASGASAARAAFDFLRRLVPTGGIVGSGAAVAAVAAIVTVQATLPRPAHWAASESAAIERGGSVESVEEALLLDDALLLPSLAVEMVEDEDAGISLVDAEGFTPDAVDEVEGFTPAGDEMEGGDFEDLFQDAEEAPLEQ